MRSFDILTGPNQQITKKTWIGGILSLISFGLLLALLRIEFLNWSEKRITKTIFVDNISQPESVSVTLSIFFPNCPCSIISLDIHDELQHHQENIPMNKFKINSKNEHLEKVFSKVHRTRNNRTKSRKLERRSFKQ